MSENVGTRNARNAKNAKNARNVENVEIENVSVLLLTALTRGPRCALSPSHRQFWIFHFSEFSTSCPNSHLVIMLYQFIITFPCSHFVHTYRSHLIVRLSTFQICQTSVSL